MGAGGGGGNPADEIAAGWLQGQQLLQQQQAAQEQGERQEIGLAGRFVEALQQLEMQKQANQFRQEKLAFEMEQAEAAGKPGPPALMRAMGRIVFGNRFTPEVEAAWLARPLEEARKITESVTLGQKRAADIEETPSKIAGRAARTELTKAQTEYTKARTELLGKEKAVTSAKTMSEKRLRLKEAIAAYDRALRHPDEIVLDERSLREKLPFIGKQHPVDALKARRAALQAQLDEISAQEAEEQTTAAPLEKEGGLSLEGLDIPAGVMDVIDSELKK